MTSHRSAWRVRPWLQQDIRLRASSALLKDIEAETIKDMGRAMAALKAQFAGRMDFSKASAMVKKLLAG